MCCSCRVVYRKYEELQTKAHAWCSWLAVLGPKRLRKDKDRIPALRPKKRGFQNSFCVGILCSGGLRSPRIFDVVRSLWVPLRVAQRSKNSARLRAPTSRGAGSDPSSRTPRSRSYLSIYIYVYIALPPPGPERFLKTTPSELHGAHFIKVGPKVGHKHLRSTSSATCKLPNQWLWSELPSHRVISRPLAWSCCQGWAANKWA